MRKPNNVPVLRKWNSSNGLNPEQSAPPITSTKMSIQRKVHEIITKRRTNDLNLPLSPTSTHPMLHRSANVIKVKVTGVRTTHSVADDSSSNERYYRARISPHNTSTKRTLSESTAYHLFQTPSDTFRRDSGVEECTTSSNDISTASTSYSSVFFNIADSATSGDDAGNENEDTTHQTCELEDPTSNDDVFTSNSETPTKHNPVRYTTYHFSYYGGYPR